MQKRKDNFLNLINNSDDVIFYLNSQLKLKSLDEKIEIVEHENNDPNRTGAVDLTKYSIKSPRTNDEFLLFPVHQGIG